MSTLMLLLSLFLVISPSFAVKVKHCKCEKENEKENDDVAPVGDKEEYKVTSTEDGQKVVEKVIIDKKKQTETIHVPSFKNVDEADIIHDFKTNLSMYRLPLRKRCYLSPLDPSLSSPVKHSHDMQQKSKNGKLETKKTESKWEVSGELKDRSFLSDEMANLCAKLPIYRIAPAKSSVSITKVRTKRGCWYCGTARQLRIRCHWHCCNIYGQTYWKCHYYHVIVRLICCN